MSDGYGKQTSGFGITREQSVDLIVQACLDNRVTDVRQIAYVLATAQHESKGFQSPEEEWGRKQAVSFAYHGGEDYFGRGYAHITHLENYHAMDTKLALAGELVLSPQRAAEPLIATRIFVLGMRDGSFVSGHALGDHIDAVQADYRSARAIINPRDIASIPIIARYAQDWEHRVPALVDRIQRQGLDFEIALVDEGAAMRLAKGDANRAVFEMQQYLVALGVRNDSGQPIAPDGDFGIGTEQAVKRYERSRAIAAPTGQVDAALFDQLRADTLQANPDFKRKTMADLYGPLGDDELRIGEKGEAVFESRLQLEALGHIRNARRDWNTDRLFDAGFESGVRRLQHDLKAVETGVLDVDTRRRLNEQATARGLPPTTEFERAENWPPMPPPYARAEYQPIQAPRAQDARLQPQAPEPPAADLRNDAAAPRPGQHAPPNAHPAADRIGAHRDPSHPGHPLHRLYQDCAAGVDALDQQLGRQGDGHSACLKASLTELAARSGLERVDHVLLSVGSGTLQAGHSVFVVQGGLQDPAHLRAHMTTGIAVATPAEASFQRLADLDLARDIERSNAMGAHELRARSTIGQSTEMRMDM